MRTSREDISRLSCILNLNSRILNPHEAPQRKDFHKSEEKNDDEDGDAHTYRPHGHDAATLAATTTPTSCTAGWVTLVLLRRPGFIS